MTKPDWPFELGQPYSVNTPSGRVAMVTSNHSDGVPLAVAVRCANAKGILRFAGTSGNMNGFDQRTLLDFAQVTFGDGRLKDIALMSGATRVLGDDREVMMTVLELPGLIRRWNPTCMACGSVPRTTETTSLFGEHSTWVPSDKIDSKTLANPEIDLFWFVQQNASTTSTYDGDLEVYGQLMTSLKDRGLPTGLVVWGGGAVTAQEVHQAVRLGHPCVVVPQSGRIASALYSWVHGENSATDKPFMPLLGSWSKQGFDFRAVEFAATPAELRAWLEQRGFYTQ